MATINLTVLSSITDKNGKFPILIRISQKTERVYIKTEFSVDDLAEFENGKVVYRKDAKIINKRLEYVFSQYKERFDEIEGVDFVTAKQIKQIISSRNIPQYVSFIDFWEKRIEEIRGEGRESYAKMNEETVRVFRLAEGNLPVQALNDVLVEHFRKWMVRKGYSSGNVGLRLTHLKARINELIRDGVLKVDVHPFAYTKIPTADPKPCDLSIEEFLRIRNAKLEGKRLTLARDMFLLSFYLCGINLKDLLNVNLSKEVLCFRRQKTATMKNRKAVVVIPICQQARDIIDKYIQRNGKIELGYAYTYSNLQKYINLCMRELRVHLGIEQPLCFYSARKTFAQFASELGIPDNVIDYCLGHSDKGRGVIRYYTKVKEKQAEIAVNRVVDYVEHPDMYKDFLEMRADIMMMRI